MLAIAMRCGWRLWRKAGICQKGSVAVAAARWEHPDIVMVPALLALADIVPISGRQFIAAHVAGAAGRVADFSHACTCRS
jgi:hypothetical protein